MAEGRDRQGTTTPREVGHLGAARSEKAWDWVWGGDVYLNLGNQVSEKVKRGTFSLAHTQGSKSQYGCPGHKVCKRVA